MGKNRKVEHQYQDLLKLCAAKKDIRTKQQAIQDQCSHKNHKGNLALKPTKDQYTFKCKLCGGKVRLYCLNGEGGNPYDKAKEGIKMVRSALDAAKIQAHPKRDIKHLEFIGSAHGRLRQIKKFLKVVLLNDKRNKKNRKRNKRNFNNVVKDGASLR